MSWPLSQDYNEAIQSPATSFSDPELKKGEAVCNALGIPMPRSGTFADVYEIRCPNGTHWAVKCFTREVAGLRERYQEISRALQDARFPFTVEFTYQQEGMRVRGRCFPILKMQWVEGLTFNEFLRQNLDKPAMLESLLQIWGRMAQWLRAASIAHADLQHGNILLVPGSTANAVAVKLIDYDGMFVPALAGKPSGEVGHPAYQHPQRARQGIYSAEVDRFPLLLIAAALRCVHAGGRSLWERYDNGDNLLFREADLKTPDGSKLFRELFGLSNARALVGMVRRSLAGPLDKVPLLEEALPELTAPPAVTTPAAKAVKGGHHSSVMPVHAVALKQAVAVGRTKKVSPAGTRTLPALPPSGARQRHKGSSLWVRSAVAGGLLALVVGLAVYALGGKWGRARPDKGEQATLQPHDTNATPTTDVKDTGRDPATDPGTRAAREPAREPQANPMNPVVRVEDGVLRLRHVLDSQTPNRALAVSADGTLGLSADGAGTIRLWDLEAGVVKKELQSGYSTVTGLAFLPGIRSFMFSANDGMVHLWDVARTDDENRLEKEWKWDPLFNGIDLTGWKPHPDNKTRWVVENGNLVGRGTPGHLFSERNDYKNLVYRIEAKINDQGVAGQHFRSSFVGPFPPSYEARINSTSNNPEHTGSLHGIVRVAEPLHKPDEWFTQEVTAVGDHIRIKVNGKVTADVHDSKYSSGHLAIKQFGPAVLTVRKIEIRELPEYAINDMDISADGGLILSACSDRILGWNLSASKPLPGKWPLLTSSTDVVRLAANGKYAVSCDKSRCGTVWDLATGTAHMTFGNPQEGGDLRAIAIAADGKLVVTGTVDGRIQLHDPEMKRSAFRELPSLGVPVKALALSPDRRYVVAAAESPPRHFLVVFDLASGKEVQRLEDTPVKANMLKFASYASRLLAADEDGRLRVFELADTPVVEMAHQPGVSLREVAAVSANRALLQTLAVTRDGKVVTVDAEGTIQVRDPDQALQVIREIADPRKPRSVISVVRGNHAVIATPTGSVHLVDLRSGERQVLEDLPERVVRFVDVTEDGSLALIGSHTGNEDTVDIRELKKNNVVRSTSASPGTILTTARFVPGKPHIAIGDNEHFLRVLNIRTGLEEQYFATGPGGVKALVAAPDGKHLVSTGLDGAVRIWDISGNELYHFDSTPGVLPNADVSADGRLGLAQFGSGPKSSLLFWDMATGRALGSVAGSESFRPRFCCFAGDGKHLVVSTTDGILTVQKIEIAMK
jgi:WD40 repeat protein